MKMLNNLIAVSFVSVMSTCAFAASTCPPGPGGSTFHAAKTNVRGNGHVIDCIYVNPRVVQEYNASPEPTFGLIEGPASWMQSDVGSYFICSSTDPSDCQFIPGNPGNYTLCGTDNTPAPTNSCSSS